MATIKLRRLLVLAFILQLSECQNKVPDVKIEVFKPKGFKASIPGKCDLYAIVYDLKLLLAIN